MQYAIEAIDVKKSYGDFQAVKGVSFQIPVGTCFGILGPNGAGKTSLLGMMEGIHKISSGQIKILGLDVATELAKIQPLLGVQLQTNNYFQFLNVEQLLDFFQELRAASINNKYRDKKAIDAMLDKVSLLDKKKVKVEELSGGQKQRLSIAIAMLEDPKILFLDEPTSALDPQNRRYTWDFIEQIKQDKDKTILLTTHHMDEAERLCDELLIMDHGKIIQQGSPSELVRSLNRHQNIVVKYKNGQFDGEFVKHAAGVVDHKDHGDSIVVSTVKSLETIKSLFNHAEERQIEITEFDVQLPNLEDVFISNTGAALRDD
ncbi:hypothetical protein C2869_04220 [Saccharobesus litoralis]|uniref:ABC transporter domain-containing protein n=1 Tax=Saccharobesus litoralis TaxID=2172099 RepID=A0A2S0VN86_9ALTE|nr:ABC transporter ATP-binding protein [Saccharobesus litoralis]AWB65691.1 hypothetical protein C2869_04220 [Saccharobesus litoralis]